MGFRPDLDLTDIIEDYQGWLDGLGEVVQKHAEYKPVETVLTPTLTKGGFGPIEATSCTALTVSPLVIWDVNGYYRSLGVHSRATRAELRIAFHEVDGGNSEYLTYVLQQLLDPEVRAEYDRLPLGELLIDKFVSAAIKRSAYEEAKRRAGGTAFAEADVQKVMGERGFDLAPEKPEPTVRGDSYSEPVDEWRWSYYMDRVVCHDVERLALWQSMLITSLSSLGVVRRFAVGFTEQHDTSTKSFTRTENGGIVVAYLGALTQPTQVLADALANTIRHP